MDWYVTACWTDARQRGKVLISCQYGCVLILGPHSFSSLRHRGVKHQSVTLVLPVSMATRIIQVTGGQVAGERRHQVHWNQHHMKWPSRLALSVCPCVRPSPVPSLTRSSLSSSTGIMSLLNVTTVCCRRTVHFVPLLQWTSSSTGGCCRKLEDCGSSGCHTSLISLVSPLNVLQLSDQDPSSLTHPDGSEFITAIPDLLSLCIWVVPCFLAPHLICRGWWVADYGEDAEERNAAANKQLCSGDRRLLMQHPTPHNESPNNMCSPLNAWCNTHCLH